MRMWMIPCEQMCNKHLLGEHVELHMLVGSIKKNKNIKGFLNGLVNVQEIEPRHAEIVQEMQKRGMNHKSEIPKFNSYLKGYVNIEENKQELKNRCPKCRELIK